jgi:hypothetical protein
MVHEGVVIRPDRDETKQSVSKGALVHIGLLLETLIPILFDTSCRLTCLVIGDI